jgi:hypothetical protein
MAQTKAKASRHTSQPDLNINSDGTRFAVRKPCDLKTFRFFQEESSQLNGPKYRVKTRIPCNIYGDFVKFVKGKYVQITEAYLDFFSAFSDEFGFRLLSVECELFTESHANVCDGSNTSRYSIHIIRLCGVEESQLFLERSINIEINKIRSVVARNGFLDMKSLVSHLFVQIWIAPFQAISKFWRASGSIG